MRVLSEQEEKEEVRQQEVPRFERSIARRASEAPTVEAPEKTRWCTEEREEGEAVAERPARDFCGARVIVGCSAVCR
jgi:hypothetical protein